MKYDDIEELVTQFGPDAMKWVGKKIVIELIDKRIKFYPYKNEKPDINYRKKGRPIFG